jgi:hypothetical protein
MAILGQSFPLRKNILLFMQQIIKLLLDIQVINKDFLATVPGVIDQEGNNRFGNGVVDVLFNYIEVRSDQSLYHLGFCLFPEFGVLGDLDDWRHTGEFVPWKVVALCVRRVE